MNGLSKSTAKLVPNNFCHHLTSESEPHSNYFKTNSFVLLFTSFERTNSKMFEISLSDISKRLPT